MKLSVIIPCLNGAATLAVQLEALSIQEWSEQWELIISDNGSTDSSIEIAQQYKDKFYALKIVDSSNRRGGAYAINNAVTEAGSNNIAVCDADDEVAPGWVAALGNALDKYEVVCGQFKFNKFNDSAEAERATKAWGAGLFVGKFLPGGGSGNYGIKKNIHQRIGGFDECLPHAYDADYFWRLQLEGHKLHSVRDAVIQVRLGRVNPTFSYMFRRARNRAASNYWCYKRYQQYGMPAPVPIKKTFIDWLAILKTGLRIVLRNNNNFEWLLKFAQKSGSLVGELQGRLTNPCKRFVPSKKIE